jgi:hypothetical protein
MSQMTNRDAYAHGGILQIIDQPSAGRKLRFQDMTPPQGTGLFNDIGSAMRHSSKASFGGERKSILKNSSAKKRVYCQTNSQDSIDM